MKRLRLSGGTRVDIQVSVLTASIVIISVLCVFGFCYSMTYSDMIFTLRERCTGIYTYVEEKFDKSTFIEINTKEDAQKESYRSMKQFLENVRKASGVRYLYTAKRRADGEFIYIVDGLPSNSPDFRHPGDLIEPEIRAEMNRALTRNSIQLPDKIKQTAWGDIFVSYLPIHSNGEVVGVIGIEFDAEHQYRTFLLLRIFTPVIVLVMCILAVRLAVVMFRRISNPHFQDIANTDYLTGLKNRNAFEVDMHNLDAGRAREDSALLSIDLNGLKLVNDTYGHGMGDAYIRAAAGLLRACVGEDQVLYRVGGDEFAVLLSSGGEDQARILLARIRAEAAADHEEGELPVSLSAGCAGFEPGRDTSVFNVYRRADERMYEDKRRQKAGGDTSR